MYKPGIISRLGLISLRQRYLAATLGICVVLASIAYFGWRHVEHLDQTQLKQIQNRAEASDALADVLLQIHTLETSLLRYITLPNSENRQIIDRAFDLYDAAIIKLSNNGWIAADRALHALILSMREDRLELYTEVEQLIIIRSDESKWFPAMNIMQETMLRNNLEFMSALDLVINEISDELDTRSALQTYKLLVEIRHVWQVMISEFRLFVANSFGVFSSDPQQGMQARRANIELYLKRIDALLARLEEFDSQGQLDLLTGHSIEEMRQWQLAWKQSYQDVEKTFDQDIWRNDLQQLKDKIGPLIDRIQERASSLQLELGVASAKDITRLTSVARELSDFVISLTVVLSIIGLLGYFVFHRSILQPIANIALALKSEALGRHHEYERLVLSDATEIQDLANAFKDMREQITIRQTHLDHIAHHDALTQLPNRILLRDRLSQAMARARRSQKMVGLMFLDLDRFKQINDTLGHDIGDRLLKIVASRISSCVRSSDTVSRLGGDEFAIVIEDVVHADQVAAMAVKILDAFNHPFLVDNQELHSSTSIGIALGPNDDNNVDALIKDADIAMYHAKDQGRNNFKFYSAEMAAQVAHHVELESQLRYALENNQLMLYFQPIVDLLTGDIISTEALLRWQHPQRGLIVAKDFMPVVEETGLVLPITQWVIDQASRQYLAHHQAGFPTLRMSINLSGKLLRNDTILDIVLNTIEETRIDPNGLLVEITEDTLLEDLHGSCKTLSTLHTMGIKIALDDFGTGQSSLSHLRRNPIDIVKIDRDFIRDIPGDKYDCELVDAVIAMAHKLKMKVVAEGVETAAQLDFLRRHACDAVQGFYFSKPLPGNEMLALLKENQRASN